VRRPKPESVSPLLLQDEAWSRPTGPSRRATVVEKAEGRLSAALKHRASVPRLIKEAERVRQAQLGYWRSWQTMAEPPTYVEDDAIDRQLENVTETIELWLSLTIHEIIAKYAPANK